MVPLIERQGATLDCQNPRERRPVLMCSCQVTSIQFLFKFQKMLVGVYSLDCHASRQLHEDFGLHVSLGVGHYEVNGPHVPSQHQGHDEDAPDCCP